MIARVGSDAFGEEYLRLDNAYKIVNKNLSHLYSSDFLGNLKLIFSNRNFEDNSVDTSYVITTKGDSTGVAPIIVDQVC